MNGYLLKVSKNSKRALCAGAGRTQKGQKTMNKEELLELINKVDSELIELCEALDWYWREAEEEDEFTEDMSNLLESLEHAQGETAELLTKYHVND
jgi:hypothetical protein